MGRPELAGAKRQTTSDSNVGQLGYKLVNGEEGSGTKGQMSGMERSDRPARSSRQRVQLKQPSDGIQPLQAVVGMGHRTGCAEWAEWPPKGGLAAHIALNQRARPNVADPSLLSFSG